MIDDFMYHKFLLAQKNSNMTTMLLRVLEKQGACFFANGFQFYCEDIAMSSAVGFHSKIIPKCFGNGCFACILFLCSSSID